MADVTEKELSEVFGIYSSDLTRKGKAFFMDLGNGNEKLARNIAATLMAYKSLIAAPAYSTDDGLETASLGSADDRHTGVAMYPESWPENWREKLEDESLSFTEKKTAALLIRENIEAATQPIPP